MLTNYNGTAITYDGIGNPLNWRNATNIYYTYDDKGSIMGMIYGGENYIFSKNLQGDVIGIYNVDGQLVAKYKYNAFGEITAITDASGNDVSGNSAHIANINPFRYRGYYYDTETGFYYLQTRYYDPVVGRMLNCDNANVITATPTALTDKNLYAYCDNNPIMRKDESGDLWNVLAGAIVGAAVGLVTSIVGEVIEDGFNLKEDFGKILTSTVIGAAEGALVATFPAACVAISAAASATESVINGAIDGDSLGDIVVDSVVSGTIGAVAGSMGPSFVKGGKLINEGAEAVGKLVKRGIHPVVKKSAKKSLKRAAKFIGKKYIEDQFDDFFYAGLNKFSSEVIKQQCCNVREVLS